MVEYVHRPFILSLIAIACYRLGIPPVWSWIYFYFCKIFGPPKSLRDTLADADLVIADFPFTGPALLLVDKSRRTLNTHNVEHVVYSNALWRSMVAKIERHGARIAQSVIGCSETDASFYRQLGCDRVAIIPNGIQLSRFKRNSEDRARIRAEIGAHPTAKLLLFAASSYGPNAEGAAFLANFAEEHADLMRLHDIHFLIVGSVYKTRKIQPGLLITGPVPEIDPYFSAADYAVNPIFSGSGTSVKLAEFIAAKLPVFTTTTGSRGFDLKENQSAWFFDKSNLAAVLADRLLKPQSPEEVLAFTSRAYLDNADRIDNSGSISRWLKSLALLLILGFAIHGPLPGQMACAQAAKKITNDQIAIEVTIPPSAESQVISPYIYGFGTYMREDRDHKSTWSMNPSIFRFGGNMAERFNWKKNSWNAGKDWFFTNYSSRFPNMVDRFIEDNNKNEVLSAVTLPMLGWVAKDDISTSLLDKKKGILSKDPSTANTPIDEKFVGEWVDHLKGKFKNGPHHYILGNEPFLWHEQHTDVQPREITKEEVLKKYLALAKEVRKRDPAAIIAGPALWGWKPLLPFLPWFLERVVAEEKKTGLKLIDIVDVHYYPANEAVRHGKPEDRQTHLARMDAVRTLWDADHVDRSWIRERIQLIPRLKKIAASARSDLKVAIGEYNFYGEKSISGGVALAEVLGIFGKEGLDYAYYWTIPPIGSPAADAFKLYRNYDNKGSAFGSQHLNLRIRGDSSQNDFAAFGALDRKKNMATIVLINKSYDKMLRTTVTMPGNSSQKSRKATFYIRDSNGFRGDPIECTEVCSVAMPGMSFGLMEVRL